MKSKILEYITHPNYLLAYFFQRKFIAKNISDLNFLKLLYKLNTGEKLEIKNPRSFREKIQWLKLYDRKPEYTTMVDKLAVKQYVKDIIGEQYIIPTIAIFDNVDDINLTVLPKQFVLKTTNGGGGCGVVICSDSANLNLQKAKNKLQRSLNTDVYIATREWPYKNVNKKCFAEQYMCEDNSNGLKDYKIFCFNGKAKYIQLIQNRNTCETIDFFDVEWNHQDFVGLNPMCKNASNTPTKPKRLHEMIEIANKLSKNIPFVRIDLYEVNSKVYFGEITFYPNSGFGRFNPNLYDDLLGEMIQLDLK